MKRVVDGVSRTVFLVRHLAFKVPCCRNGWQMFLRGFLANMQEVEWGKAGLDGICPVLWSLPLGLLVVMPRVDVLTEAMSDEEYAAFCNRGDYVIPAENKADSFGYWRGHLVAIDYGN